MTLLYEEAKKGKEGRQQEKIRYERIGKKKKNNHNHGQSYVISSTVGCDIVTASVTATGDGDSNR